MNSPKKKKKDVQNLSAAVLANLYWFFSPPGSPFSTSEPSIEPEGQSSGGTEDNYHRNMSWLHVRLFKYFISGLLRVLVSTAASFPDHDPAVQPAELHLHPHRLLPPALLPAPQPLLRSPGSGHQTCIRRDGRQSEGGQRHLWPHHGTRKEEQGSRSDLR